MKNLFLKIKRRLKMTFGKFKADCKFSFKLALYRFVDEFGGRIGFKRLSSKAHKAKDEWILSYLKKTLSPVLDEYRNDTDVGTYNEKAPIWVCWWTGEESAPPLVKRCIKSIHENANGHPVHFIDQNNYSDFIDFPSYIIDKVNSGDMCLANFSDIIRVSLIKKHGGLWLDSTVYCSKPLPELYFELPFFSCKSEEKECGYISRMRWTAFIMGGYKGNIFARYMRSSFELYWQNHESAIDYLLVDYLIELAYREIPKIKELIDGIPLNNVHRDDLQDAMYQCVPASKFDDVLSDDTTLYKLSWRENFNTERTDGNKTVYAHFING